MLILVTLDSGRLVYSLEFFLDQSSRGEKESKKIACSVDEANGIYQNFEWGSKGCSHGCPQ